MRRDFTQSTVQQLYATIDAIKGDGQWGVTDFFTDMYESVPDLSDVTAYQRSVLDKYDIAEQDLDSILKSVGSVDDSYQWQLLDCVDMISEFAQRIRNMADLLTAQVLSYDPDRFKDLGNRIVSNYRDTVHDSEQDIADERGATDQLLDELEGWFEKLENGVGGAAVTVVENVVVAPLGELFGLFDAMFGTRFQQGLQELQDAGDQYILDHLVTNEQWYYGGRTVGDAVSVAGGVVMCLAGVAEIIGSITLGEAGVLISTTGVGVVVGVPAVAISVAGVAAGAGMIGGGIIMARSGGDNIGKDLAASQAAMKRQHPEPFSGEPTPHPTIEYDPDAHKLADRIGGMPQAYFSEDRSMEEFDVISDQYVAQAKPSNFKKNKAWREQAKNTFEAAMDTGRTPYFHFEGPPSPEVIRKLNEYAERYGIPYVLDTTPF